MLWHFAKYPHRYSIAIAIDTHLLFCMALCTYVNVIIRDVRTSEGEKQFIKASVSESN